MTCDDFVYLGVYFCRHSSEHEMTMPRRTSTRTSSVGRWLDVKSGDYFSNEPKPQQTIAISKPTMGHTHCKGYRVRTEATDGLYPLCTVQHITSPFCTEYEPLSYENIRLNLKTPWSRMPKSYNKRLKHRLRHPPPLSKSPFPLRKLDPDPVLFHSIS